MICLFGISGSFRSVLEGWASRRYAAEYDNNIAFLRVAVEGERYIRAVRSTSGLGGSDLPDTGDRYIAAFNDSTGEDKPSILRNLDSRFGGDRERRCIRRDRVNGRSQVDVFTPYRRRRK